MKALILAAGYGTRLERDLKAAPQYRHLLGVPKPLLPVGGQPLISHWYLPLQSVDAIDAIYVVTNGVNYQAFEEWAKNKPQVKLVSDGSTSNETRSGAVAAIKLAIDHFNIHDNLIVIAGDTLFYEDFKLTNIVKKFEEFQSSCGDSSLVLHVTVSDEEVGKRGILETEGSRVIQMLEKPQADETKSRKSCPCFYVLHQTALPCVSQFLDNTKELPLKSRDAPGNFIAYLCSRQSIHTMEVSGRYDVGGLDSYLTCHNHFMDIQVKQD